MNPSKVIREKVSKLIDLPNIGKTVAHDLTRMVGLHCRAQGALRR